MYLDGQLLGSYANTSTSSPNWQTLSYTFTGDGSPQTLSVQLINGTDTSTPRGAMLDQLSLVETLPDSASTVYGFAGRPIALPQVSDSLAANDPGTLATTLTGLPDGSTVSDGVHSVSIDERTPTVDISSWNLANLTITVPHDDQQSPIIVNITATSTDPNGSTASTSESVTINLLDGAPCATPVGINPYVSYTNGTAISQSTGPIYPINVVASPLTPLAGGYVITSTACDNAGNGNDGQFDMDGLWNSLSESVSNALFSELGLGK